MCDEVPAYRVPSPDAGHEAIRAPLADAIDALTEQASGLDDGYFLDEVLFGLLDDALAQIQALSDRLAALESPLILPED